MSSRNSIFQTPSIRWGVTSCWRPSNKPVQKSTTFVDPHMKTAHGFSMRITWYYLRRDPSRVIRWAPFCSVMRFTQYSSLWKVVSLLDIWMTLQLGGDQHTVTSDYLMIETKAAEMGLNLNVSKCEVITNDPLCLNSTFGGFNIMSPQRRNSAGGPASGWLSDESDSGGEVLRSQ